MSVQTLTQGPKHRVRARALNILREIIYRYTSSEFAEAVAINLERSAYNYTVNRHSNEHAYWNKNPVEETYKTRVRQLMFNLDEAKKGVRNSQLIRRLLLGTVTAQDIGESMNYMDMYPDRYRSHFEQVQKDFEQRKNLKETDLTNVNGMLKCSRCKGKKTTYEAKQTRSGDEPMTIFATCLNCDHTWRFS